LYFQLPYLPEKTCFQQAGSSAVEGTHSNHRRACVYPFPIRNTTNSTGLLQSRKAKKKKEKVGDVKDSSGRLSWGITRYCCWLCTSKKQVDCTCKSHSLQPHALVVDTRD
jgi:hypothetical protein